MSESCVLCEQCKWLKTMPKLFGLLRREAMSRAKCSHPVLGVLPGEQFVSITLGPESMRYASKVREAEGPFCSGWEAS